MSGTFSNSLFDETFRSGPWDGTWLVVPSRANDGTMTVFPAGVSFGTWSTVPERVIGGTWSTARRKTFRNGSFW